MEVEEEEKEQKYTASYNMTKFYYNEHKMMERN